MANVRGTIPTEKVNTGIPIYAPPCRMGHWVPYHTGVDGIIIQYRSEASSIRTVLPDCLEIEENPVVTTMMIYYEHTPWGPYNELIQFVEVTWRAKVYDYFFALIVDNEDAVYSGREMFGYPKVLGTFDFNLKPNPPGGFMRGVVSRPSTTPLAEILFKPGKRLDISAGDLPSRTKLTLRVIPTAFSDTPAVRQMVEVGLKILDGEVWEGVGSINYPSRSEFDPLYKFPVKEYISSTLIRNVGAVMEPLPIFNDI